jgi:aminoglycoside phosphotransferase family enzyme
MTAADEATRSLVDALRRPAAYQEPPGEVELIETHISAVFLAGTYAYKIKKPVDLGFLDFSSLARREHFCREELRLNRRLAPSLYLDVVPVTAGPHGPRFGGEGPPLEWAVMMRRFDQAAQLDRQLAAGLVTTEDMDAVAAHIAAFHDAATVAPGDRPWGTAAAVVAPVDANFATLQPALADTSLAPALARLADWSARQASALGERFEQRRIDGRVRECHGDLHLRNMARVDDRIVAFDGIEFEPALRWIDVMSDSAFLLMDLCSRDRPDLGWRFMNGWLAATGDYDGLALLDWYLCYRHLVRAKVDAIRLCQTDVEAAERDRLRERIGRHVAQAESTITPRQPALLLTHGLSGSGKSWLAKRLCTALPAVLLRSDVERKRLFGLAPEHHGDTAERERLYDAGATERTYAELERRAAALLAAGLDVIVDATFLAPALRARFARLAEGPEVRGALLECRASHATLAARIEARAAAGGDPSDADLAVLDDQLARQTAPGTEVAGLERFVLEEGDDVDASIGRLAAWMQAPPGYSPRQASPTALSRPATRAA